MAAPAWELYGGVALALALIVVGLARLSEGLLRERIDEPPGAESGSTTDARGEVTADPDARAPAEPEPETELETETETETETELETETETARTPDASLDSAAARRRAAIADRGFTPGELLLNVLFSHGLLGVILAAVAWYAAIPLDALGATAAAVSGPLVAVGTGLGVAFYLVDEGLAALADQFGVGYSEALRSAMAPESRVGWVVLLGAVLPITAAFEELLFRATLVGALAAGTGASPWLLAVGSSVLFGLAHGVQGRLGVLVTGALGFGLAAAFVLTESLLCVIVAHYLVNALEFVVHEGRGAGDRVG